MKTARAVVSCNNETEKKKLGLNASIQQQKMQAEETRVAQYKRVERGKLRKIDEIVRLYIEEIFTEV